MEAEAGATLLADVSGAQEAAHAPRKQQATAKAAELAAPTGVVAIVEASIAAASMLLSIAAARAAVRARDRDTLLRLAPVTGYAMLPRPPAHRCQSRRSTSTR